MAGKHISPERIYPVVVVGGPFPVNPFSAATIREQLADKTPAVIGEDDRCRPPMILDLASYLMLLRSAQAHQLRTPDILQMWVDSPLAEGTFRNWLVTDGPTPPVDSTWEDRVYAAVGLPGPAARNSGNRHESPPS